MRARTLLALGAFVLVILLGFAFFALRTTEGPVPKKEAVATTAPPAVTIKDAYKKGSHTVSGTVAVANPCQKVDAEASVAASTTPDTIRVDITVQPDTGVCLQLPGTASFTVKAAADANATIATYVNGASVTPQ